MRSHRIGSLLLVLAVLVPVRAASPQAQGTLSVAITLDARSARLAGTALSARPPLDPGPLVPIAASPDDAPAVVELVVGAGEAPVRRIAVEGLCLAHPPGTPAHVTGDRVRLHAETIVVELPAASRTAPLEVAFYRQTGAGPLERVSLGHLDLAAPLAPAATPSTIHWPEEYGDPDKVRTWGDAGDSARRINIVLVPDGFTYAEKPMMEAYAQEMIDHFRARSPFYEHDLFFNYHLVYAYSTQTGTDTCDCGGVRDTAMNTGFPSAGSPCGDSGNRCLYYDQGCDGASGSAHIAQAELRAPAKDTTIVFVNTARYGGCGGARAVYAAGDPVGPEIALHEIGHSLARLADEYDTDSGCGTYAGEINTSKNPSTGAWPEWIPDLGPPTQGAEYYTHCLYRPQSNCRMRTLGQPYCLVCQQHWALSIFGHARITSTAPVASSSPQLTFSTPVDTPVTFRVETRMSPAEVGNRTVWTVSGPGYDSATVLGEDVGEITTDFAPAGPYVVTCDVTADRYIIKPERASANIDVLQWHVTATGVPEVSRRLGKDLLVRKNGAALSLSFEDAGTARYNVYVSKTPATAPFRVADPSQGKKDCAIPNEADGFGRRRIPAYDPAAGLTAPGPILFLLVTADNGPGTEGSLGRASGGTERTADARCSR